MWSSIPEVLLPQQHPTICNILFYSLPHIPSLYIYIFQEKLGVLHNVFYTFPPTYAYAHWVTIILLIITLLYIVRLFAIINMINNKIACYRIAGCSHFLSNFPVLYYPDATQAKTTVPQTTETLRVQVQVL